MASSQVKRPGVDEEKLEAVANVAICNSTTARKIEIKYINEYSGNFRSSPAQTIEMNKNNLFVHDGISPNGSKVGMAYAANGHQWIMAWSVPLQPSDVPFPTNLNKVYVEDGPDAEIDWKEIERKLDLSTGDESKSPGANAAICTYGSKPCLATTFY